MTGEPVVSIIDEGPLRSALDSLFRSTSLITRLYQSVAAFTRSPPWSDARDCLVLDVQLPGMIGLDFQQELDSMDISGIMRCEGMQKQIATRRAIVCAISCRSESDRQVSSGPSR
jgi:DNA-binding NtrC family response regulator